MALDTNGWGRFLTAAAKIIRDITASRPSGTSGKSGTSVRSGAPKRTQRRRNRPAAAPGPAPTPAPTARSGGLPPAGRYPGDFTGTAKISYHPDPDGAPDPGEIVWTWVPYEEDHSRGKDRPVLLIGNSGSYLLAVMLTSKDHSTAQHQDPDYIDIGTGPWDRQGRPSEVKLGRVLRINPADVRREGAILERKKFERIAERLRSAHGWN